MQGEKITKRILEDANSKANSILSEAETQAEKILEKACNFEKEKNAERLKKVEDYKISVEEKYKTLLKIEQNKILLNTKQNVLENLKLKAVSFLGQQNAKDKLEFIEKIIKKYAEEGETILFNLKNIAEKDIANLKVVKTLKLDVKKQSLEEEGIILSNKNCDKNLLFSTLVAQSFEENENKIVKQLF